MSNRYPTWYFWPLLTSFYLQVPKERKDGLTIAKNSWITNRVFRCGPQSSLEADFPRLIVFSGHRRRFFPFALARQQLQAAGVVEAPKVWIKRWFHLVFPTSTTRTLGVMGVLQRSIYHMVIMPIGEKSICPLFFALWSQDFSKCSTIFWKINDRFLTSKLRASIWKYCCGLDFENVMSLMDFTDYFWIHYEQNFDWKKWVKQLMWDITTKFLSLLMHFKSLERKVSLIFFPLCNLNICRKSD